MPQGQQRAQAGERINAEVVKKAYEQNFTGQFAAIDVKSQGAVVGMHAEDAIEGALSRFDAPLLHLLPIGSYSALAVSCCLNETGAGLRVFQSD